MILVGSQRGGPKNLADHLLKTTENDHVTVHEIRGFMSDTLHGAFHEAQAVAAGTRAKQFLFSLSFNPPKDADVSVDQLGEAVDRAEDFLGLKGQPRALVIHEKNGRRHAHAVWSRIDAQTMTAIEMSFFKRKLNAFSKVLFLENGWDLPNGYRVNKWKNPLNFTFAEWQQAKTIDLDPRELKQIFQSAWARSDDLPSLQAALDEHGLFLAQGDRRSFVARDVNGNVFSLARWSGVKVRDIKARIGEAKTLPTLQEVRRRTQDRLWENLKARTQEAREKQSADLAPLHDERKVMQAEQAKQREKLARFQLHRDGEERRARASRYRRGVLGIWDRLTGRARALRRQNFQELRQGYLRNKDERQALYALQRSARAELQTRYDAVRDRHRAERQEFVKHTKKLLHRDQLLKSAKAPRSRSKSRSQSYTP